MTILKLDRIGDFILCTAALHALRDAFPSARFTLIVREPSSEIARQQFATWEIVTLPPRQNALRNLIAQRGVRKALATLPKADLLVDLRAYRDYSDTVIASWVPARFKLGICNAFSDDFAEIRFPEEVSIYDVLVPREAPRSDECADVSGQRGLISYLTNRAISIRPRLAVSGEERSSVRDKLQTHFGISPSLPYALVFPGTSSEIKELPTLQLARGLVDGLASAETLPVIVGGAPADSRTTKPLVTELSKHRTVFDATGLFGLSENVALIAESRILVGLDSCHIHTAGALNVPAVGILGGGQFGDFAPWGESERFRWVHHRTPCYGCQWVCPYSHPICLHDIPPAAIAEAIRAVLLASA